MHSETRHHKQNSAWPCCLSSLCWWDEHFLCRGSPSLLPSAHFHSVCLGVEGQKRGKLSKMADARQRGITPADKCSRIRLRRCLPPCDEYTASRCRLCNGCSFKALLIVLFFLNREHGDEVRCTYGRKKNIDIQQLEGILCFSVCHLVWWSIQQ